MGALDVESMRDELRFTVGGYTSTELTDPLVDRWLRWAYLHISQPSIYEHRELFLSAQLPLLVNDPTYGFAPLPFGFVAAATNVQAVSLVVNESRGQRLIPLSLRQYQEIARNSDGTIMTGRPSHYMVAGTDMYIYPAPNANHAADFVRVWYWSKPNTLGVPPNPATNLADEWDEAIIVGATWRAFRSLNLQDRAEIAKAEFGQLINEISERLRADMREDAAGRRLELELDDYQSHSF